MLVCQEIGKGLRTNLDSDGFLALDLFVEVNLLGGHPVQLHLQRLRQDEVLVDDGRVHRVFELVDLETQLTELHLGTKVATANIRKRK